MATGKRKAGVPYSIDVDAVIRMTWDGKTAAHIAEVLDVNPRSVSRVRVRARNAGIPMPPPDHVRSDCRAGRGSGYVAAPRPARPRLLGTPTATRDTGVDWRHRALCRDEDPELFFPTGTTGPAERQAEEAKAVCRRCAVTSFCLAWALETGQDYGVWGGTTEGERRALKRQQVHTGVRTA